MKLSVLFAACIMLLGVAVFAQRAALGIKVGEQRTYQATEKISIDAVEATKQWGSCDEEKYSYYKKRTYLVTVNRKFPSFTVERKLLGTQYVADPK